MHKRVHVYHAALEIEPYGIVHIYMYIMQAHVEMKMHMYWQLHVEN